MNKKLHLFSLIFLSLIGFSSVAQSAQVVNCPAGFAALAPETSFHTERLTLAPIEQQDFPKAVAIYMDPQVGKMSGDIYDAGTFMQVVASGQRSIPENAASLRVLNLGIKDQKGEFLGIVQLGGGANPGSHTTNPAIAGKPGNYGVTGYHLSPSTWGRGIASEATAKMFSYGFDKLKLDGIFAEVIPTNIGSARVLEKQGFIKVSSAGEIDHYNHYYLSRERYLELKAPAAVEKVQINNQFINDNNFRVNRDLPNYNYQLPLEGGKGIETTLEKLPQHSVWVDMGAGEARALNDGLEKYPNIEKGIGIAFKRPLNATDSRPDGRLQYLDGDYVENMYQSGKLNSVKGKTDLITDVYGPISYSEDIPKLLQTYMDLLKPDGKLIFNIMSERNFSTALNQNRVINPGTVVPINKVSNGKVNADDPTGMIDWLRKIPGIKVVETKQVKATHGNLYESSYSVEIIKTQPNVTIPNNLRTKTYEPSNPPLRTFELSGQAIQPGGSNRIDSKNKIVFAVPVQRSRSNVAENTVAA
jgi:ribosomal-protein-alanine N-acetyltransferase